jgi:hypothetical protein
MIEDMAALFEKYEDSEWDNFKLIENKFSTRRDLHAFILLDKLVPGKCNIISASEHDQYWLETDVKQLAKVATEENIRDLVRCGVCYDEGNESLYRFS